MSLKRFATGAIGAGVIAASIPFISGWEGRSLQAYLDPVGIPTICDGETQGVRLGDQKTHAECDALTKARVSYFAYWVDWYVIPTMPQSRHMALTSFAYNVGLENFKRSTALKKLNTGDAVGGCNELTKWVYAKGKKLPGLARRREAERQLCLKDGV